MSDETRTLLAEAVRQLAAHRRAAQSPLTPEEILALTSGELEGGKREEVEERLSVEPEAAQALLDVRRFPDLELRKDGPYLEEFELEARWRNLRSSWVREGEPSPRQALVSHFLPLAAAALVALALGLGGWVVLLRQQLEDLRGPRANLEVISLLPEEDSLRAVGRGEEVPSGAGLVLILNHVATGVHEEYRLEVKPVEGPPLFTVDRLRRHPTLGNFAVELPWAELPSGELQLVLSGVAVEGWEQVASYRLWIGAEPVP